MVNEQQSHIFFLKVMLLHTLGDIVIEPGMIFEVTEVLTEKNRDESKWTTVVAKVLKSESIVEKAVKVFNKKYLERAKYFKSRPHLHLIVNPLENILSINKDFKPKSIAEAIKDTGFEDPEGLINMCLPKLRILSNLDVLKYLGMTYIEAIALISYTSDKEGGSNGEELYQLVNKALAERKEKELKDVSHYIFYLLSALRKLKKYKAEGKALYRGVQDDSGASIRQYREGDELIWTSFTSTSTEKKRAYKFIGKGHKGIIYEIYGKYRGYRISPFSLHKDEQGNLHTH